MVKTYLLNQRLNNSTFTIQAEGGNRVCYQFKGGDVVNRVLPYFMTEDPYYQYVIEKSDLFKQGIIKYDPQTAKEVAADNLRKAQEEAQKVEEEHTNNEESLIEIKGISSVAEAINYCAEHFGKVAKTAKQAKDIAQQNGYDFVNLKTGKG